MEDCLSNSRGTSSWWGCLCPWTCWSECLGTDAKDVLDEPLEGTSTELLLLSGGN